MSNKQGTFRRQGNRMSSWWQNHFGGWGKKFSAVGRLMAQTRLGRAVWTPRQYDNLAEEAYVKNAVAYRCVRLIAEAAANIPWIVSEGSTEMSDHPLISLLNRPNRFQGGAEMFDSLYSYIQLAGNAYLEGVLLRGDIRELYSLRPDRMRVVPGYNGWPEAYDYTVGSNTHTFPVPELSTQQSPILHLKTFHPLNDYYGLSPVEAAAYAIDQHAAQSDFNKALLDNRATPSGNLWTEKDLDEEQFNRLKSDIDERYTGKQNAGRPLLTEGGVRWQSISWTPQEMAIIENKRELAREIAFSFGVPPMLLGIPGDNTYSNYQEANRAFYRSTVLPLVDRTSDSLTAFFQPTWPGIHVTYDIDQVEALSEEREAAWKRVKDAPFLTYDEKREAVGYKPLTAKQRLEVFVPAGMVPIDLVGFEGGGEEPDDPDAEDTKPDEEDPEKPDAEEEGPDA